MTNNNSFVPYKILVVHSSIYPTVENVSYSRAQYYKEVFFYKEYPSFIKKYSKATDKLKLNEYYLAEVFFIPDIKSITIEDCIRFSEQASDLFVGVQGISGSWEKLEKNKKSTVWTDSNGEFWSPVIFDNPGNSFEFNLGCFNFNKDKNNYLIIFSLVV